MSIADDGDGQGCEGAGVAPDGPDGQQGAETPDQVNAEAPMPPDITPSIWDFTSIPWSGTILFPAAAAGPFASVSAGPTVAYNPRTDTGCAGVAVAAAAPAGGHSWSVGPLTVGNLGNADNILGGWSVFASAQIDPSHGRDGYGKQGWKLRGRDLWIAGCRGRLLSFRV